MNKEVQMNKLLLVIALLSFVFSFSSYAGKKECQSYLAKLRNVQAQQRAGYGNVKGRTLADREQKARDKWWQCQQGKLPKAKKRNKRNKRKKKMVKVSNKKIPIPSANGTNQSITNKLVIKGKYQGQQQQDWLDYYQKPDKCKEVKSTKIFAYCIEDETRQQQIFEESLSKLND